MKAREFLAQKTDDLTLRNLIKEPLSVDEIRTLASKVGGARNLVAPKRRTEAAQISDAALPDWLAADGARVRRPIIVSGKRALLGFAADVQAEVGRLF